jgi:formylglycine-generating enzyme required for sulfatase activity/serine/threonine protein kinase
MPPIAKCPNCEAVHRVPKESQGTHKRCEQCGTTFTVEIHLDETGVVFPGPKTPVQPAPSAKAAEKQTSAKAKQTTLGQYVLQRKLGEGGMGEVYLAHDPNLDRYVAIKILPAVLSTDKQNVERFLREARSAAKLHHTNVATVYQIGTEGKLIYIAMEYVNGLSLDKSVVAEGPMHWREATAVIQDAAAALAAAHDMDLVHRDIKPSNLMRTLSGVTKVVDFGLARAMSSNTNITQQGRILGTPAYMSPEQWMGKETDGRSDLYSLICTYYYLLTGKQPFEADSMPALGYQHRYEPFPDARILVPDLPVAVCQVLAKGSQKEPSQRYRTAGQLIAALDGLEFAALAESDGLGAAPHEPLVPQQTPVPRAGQTTSGPLATRTTPIGPSVLTRGPLLRPVRTKSPAPHTGVPRWAIIAAAALGAIVLLVLIIRLSTNNGTENQGTDKLAHAKPETKLPPPPPPPAKEAPPSLPATPPASPPPAVAPFDAKRAKDRQRAWAKSHDVSWEITNSIGMKMVLIPPGEFMMGSPQEEKDRADNEGPQHRVRITKPFYLGVYAVTQEEYERVMGNNPSHFKKSEGLDTGRFPVESVSWKNAVEFCRKLSALREEKEAGYVYRLPTEAQWEYACRAGSTSKFYYGDDEGIVEQNVWYCNNSQGRTHPVGGKQPNVWGLCDMHGNVWQWCLDWYGEGYYAVSPGDDPTGPASGRDRVERGGSWEFSAYRLRSAMRSSYPPGLSYNNLGFRVSLVLVETVPARAEVTPPAKPAAQPLARAPFDAEKAKEHQQAWADHRNIEVETTNSIGMKLVLIPPGDFQMGSPQDENGRYDDEGPQHWVRITKPFYLGVYAVTQEEYERVMGNNPSGFKKSEEADKQRFPVENVSWEDAKKFCEQLSALPKEREQGHVYRLPTEAQWEYACRAGSITRYCFGDDVSKLKDYAWYGSNGGTHPVGKKRPNAFGLYDMHGNVWQWCEDWFGSYAASAVVDPTGPASGSCRVDRGGGWDVVAGGCRSAYRFDSPGLRGYSLGFRVSLVLAEENDSKQGD